MPNCWKLIPFYVATIGVVVLFGMLLCVIQILKYIYNPNSISGFIVGFMATLVALSFLCWAFSIPTIKFGNNMVNYMNVLADFEEKVGKLEQKHLKVCTFVLSSVQILNPEHATVLRPQITWRNYYQDFRREIQLLIRGRPCDMFGILLNLATVYVLYFIVCGSRWNLLSS